MKIWRFDHWIHWNIDYINNLLLVNFMITQIGTLSDYCWYTSWSFLIMSVNDEYFSYLNYRRFSFCYQDEVHFLMKYIELGNGKISLFQQLDSCEKSSDNRVKIFQKLIKRDDNGLTDSSAAGIKYEKGTWYMGYGTM